MKIKIPSMHGVESIFSMFQSRGLLFYPSREWFLGLCAATALFFGSVLYIGFDFYNQFYVSRDIEGVIAPTIQYHGKEVQEYAAKYNEKERVFSSLRNSETPPVILEKEVSPEAKPTANQDSEVPLAKVELGQ